MCTIITEIVDWRHFINCPRELAKQEGRVEGEQRLVLLLLSRRFGEIDASIIERVRLLSTEQLEALGQALLDFSAVTDLEAWLNQQL